MPQLFVGAWLPPKVRTAVADYPRPNVADVRWSTPSQWLVKLRPLGHVDDRIVPALLEVLQFELDGAPKAKARFGPVHRDGWLTAPVEGLEELVSVVFDATLALVPVTHPQAWQAELTLARGRVPKELVQPLAASWTVTSVSLAKATRSKEGPGYEDVAAIPLGA